MIAACFRRDWQDAARRLDRSVERQLADVDDTAEVLAFHDVGRGEHADGDWQIERRAGLSHIARSEIDGDS